MRICPATSSFATAAAVRMNHTLALQLQASPVFRDYQQAFETTTGLPLRLQAAVAPDVPPVDARFHLPFCAIRSGATPRCATCRRLQLQAEAGTATRTTILECSSGLIQTVVPVRMGRMVIAYLQTGNVAFSTPTPERFARIVRQIKEISGTMDKQFLRNAYLHTRVVARSHYRSILRLLEIFALQLSSLGNEVALAAKPVEPDYISQARRYIATHHTNNLTLPEVAHAVKISPFYFCKRFRQETGLNFTNYLARIRVEHVNQLLLNPHINVSEAAFQAGFQSLSQFNRAFRRISGEAPTSYRDRLHSHHAEGRKPPRGDANSYAA